MVVDDAHGTAHQVRGFAARGVLTARASMRRRAAAAAAGPPGFAVSETRQRLTS